MHVVTLYGTDLNAGWGGVGLVILHPQTPSHPSVPLARCVHGWKGRGAATFQQERAKKINKS